MTHAIVTRMQRLVVPSMAGDQSANGESSAAPAPDAPMLAVLWRRRWIIAAAVALCVVSAIAYLAVAPRIYESVAVVAVGQSGPKVIKENEAPPAPTDGFLF